MSIHRLRSSGWNHRWGGPVGVVVGDVGATSVRVEDPRPSVGAVALGGDALVPVVERRGGGFGGDLLRPRVLPRRLVEVPVDDEPNVSHLAFDSTGETNV